MWFQLLKPNTYIEWLDCNYHIDYIVSNNLKVEMYIAGIKGQRVKEMYTYLLPEFDQIIYSNIMDGDDGEYSNISFNELLGISDPLKRFEIAEYWSNRCVLSIEEHIQSILIWIKYGYCRTKLPLMVESWLFQPIEYNQNLKIQCFTSMVESEDHTLEEMFHVINSIPTDTEKRIFICMWVFYIASATKDIEVVQKCYSSLISLNLRWVRKVYLDCVRYYPLLWEDNNCFWEDIHLLYQTDYLWMNRYKDDLSHINEWNEISKNNILWYQCIDPEIFYVYFQNKTPPPSIVTKKFFKISIDVSESNGELLMRYKSKLQDYNHDIHRDVDETILLDTYVSVIGKRKQIFLLQLLESKLVTCCWTSLVNINPYLYCARELNFPIQSNDILCLRFTALPVPQLYDQLTLDRIKQNFPFFIMNMNLITESTYYFHKEYNDINAIDCLFLIHQKLQRNYQLSKYPVIFFQNLTYLNHYARCISNLPNKPPSFHQFIRVCKAMYCTEENIIQVDQMIEFLVSTNILPPNFKNRMVYKDYNENS